MMGSIIECMKFICEKRTMKTKPLAFLVWLITMTSFGQQPTECATPRKDSAAFFAQPWVQDPNYLGTRFTKLRYNQRILS